MFGFTVVSWKDLNKSAHSSVPITDQDLLNQCFSNCHGYVKHQAQTIWEKKVMRKQLLNKL